jgi:hypothetical protein
MNASMPGVEVVTDSKLATGIEAGEAVGWMREAVIAAESPRPGNLSGSRCTRARRPVA